MKPAGSWNPPAHGETLYAAFVLILVLGLRKGEVLGLTWELIDLDTAELTSASRSNGSATSCSAARSRPRRPKRRCPCPMCVAALKLRKEQQDADREPRRRTPGSIPAWSSPPGTAAIEPAELQPELRPLHQPRRGVPRITVHGTRKTCGSLLAALDVHPRVAMQLLRHSRIAVTMEIYTEAISAATRDALKKLWRMALAAKTLLYSGVVRAAKRAGYKIATGL